ncbi:O-succinylhomoserine sulfhydrylase [Polycyclovorans algicola]|uniref:O-succinylhomoserine sulfhydrylase n=1 Tax=Polycyclovorans algicola TaxID=616992 RepID=UPI0004A709F8|nr:O-succinylhomoserine sulfhydrylase [Polycyclovorans algicola]
MTLPIDPDWSTATLGVRAAAPETLSRDHSLPIALTSSFTFESAAQAAASFADPDPDAFIYSRFTNPTVQAFEQRLAAMEGGESCIATASGMAAIFTLCLAVMKTGDHLLTSRGLFGSTTQVFNNWLSRVGISVTYVDMADLQAWDAGFRDNTRLVFVETPSNPLMQLVDIAGLSALCKTRGVPLAVDNCFLTPILQKPLALGADFVIHSATKYLDGQGRCVGGAIVGDAQRVGKDIFGFMRNCGPCMSPFNAWVFFKGLETLKVRMDAHARHANEVALWLAQHPKVDTVHFPGLPQHPQYALAQAQQRTGGGIVSFEVKGGRDTAWRFIDATRLCSITANLGDARTTVTHPASTTHGRISAEARAAAGITEGLVRIAVGLEDPVDLIADLDRALGGA